MSVRMVEARRGPWAHSRLGGAALLLRHRRPVHGPSVLVALLVLAVAVLLAATPSVFAVMAADELSQTVEQAPPSSRYLISRTGGQWVTGPSKHPAASGLAGGVDDQFGAFQDQMRRVRARLPEPLRALVGAPGFSIGSTVLGGSGRLSTTPSGATTQFIVRMDPHLDRRAELVAGRWPDTAAPMSTPVAVTVSERTAQVLGWRIGQRVELTGPPGLSGTVAGSGPAAVLVGIFRPKDPHADYWALHPTVVQPNVFDDGNSTPRITSTMYADPAAFVGLVPRVSDRTILIWYPLRLDRMPGTQAARILGQLRGATATPFDVPTDQPADIRSGTIQSLRLTADVIPELASALGRVQAARSVLTVAAGGPLAAALAVLVLATGAMARRRRPLAALLATRGVTVGRIRLLLAADGLLTGLPAAVLAAAGVWWWFGGDASPAGLGLGLSAGLLPAALLAGLRIQAGLRPARADTGIRRSGRLRWVAEIAVLGLAAVSLYLLLSAGLGTGAGTDLLVAAAPLLLAAAACVLVLRLYPLPLRALTAMFRRRRAAVGFLGSARALRDPVVGVAPVLAVLAGVSVAVFSAVTLSTLTHGTGQAALSQLGAALRVTGVTVTDARYDEIRELPGVAAAARTMLVGSVPVQIGDRPTQPFVDVYRADTAALRRVQDGVPGAVAVPGGMTGGRVPGAIVSAGLAEPGTTLDVGQLRLRVLGTAERPTGLGQSSDFVLIDSSVTGLDDFWPDAVLVRPAAGADDAAVGAALGRLLGPAATVRLAADDAATLQRGAIATGMRVALIGALAAAALAAVAALLLTMVLGAPARARLLAILRVLGLSVRQRRWLVVWEQAPAALAALLVGGGLGVGLSVLVRAAVDLTPFTGGATQPELHTDAALLAVLLGGFLVLVMAATGIGLAATRRVTAARAIKLDEE